MEAGAAYVFVRDGTNWSQQAYLKASNTDGHDPITDQPGDTFGTSVGISGDTVVVGAAFEASNAAGVNGNQSDNSSPVAGAAYVFVRSATNWSQQAYLKASNTRTFDEFAIFVAVSDDTVVVGADGDFSNATGVNGNQSNTNAPFSGAAYVFTGLGTENRLTIASDGSSGYLIRFKGVPNLAYRLQRAATLSGPWDTIDMQSAPASGIIEFHEAAPLLNTAFYRAVQP